MSNIKTRVLQLSESVEVSKKEFFKKIGITYGNFTGKSKETPLNSNTIENILVLYPETNLYWLLTGIGEMLKNDEHKDEKNVSLELIRHVGVLGMKIKVIGRLIDISYCGEYPINLSADDIKGIELIKEYGTASLIIKILEEANETSEKTDYNKLIIDIKKLIIKADKLIFNYSEIALLSVRGENVFSEMIHDFHDFKKSIINL